MARNPRIAGAPRRVAPGSLPANLPIRPFDSPAIPPYSPLEERQKKYLTGGFTDGSFASQV